MKVKELITFLLDERMDAEVSVSLEDGEDTSNLIAFNLERCTPRSVVLTTKDTLKRK